MRNMLLLLLCTLVAALGIRETLACSCQPEHPSQQFCRADFVIKAKVVSKLEIYPTNEPVFEPTTKPEDPKPLPPGYDIEPELPQVHQPDSLAQLGGTLRMPGGGLLPPNGGIQALGGAPSGGIQALGGMLGGGMFPGPVIPGANEVRPIELEYSIKVDKIFKTNLDVKLDPKTTAKIYTAPWDGMCGVSWLVNGETYLLTGSYYDDKLRISTCNWIDLYDDLTRRQKRGVKAAYKADCYERDDKNACQICFYDGCTEFKQDSCIWDAFSPYEDCESLHSRCKRNTKGKCQWERKREYRKCDVQRQTEQIDTTPFDL